MTELIRIDDQNAMPNLLEVFSGEKWPDTISAWIEAYFQFEVATSERSRKEQMRDLRLFVAFMVAEAGSEARVQWTPRLSRTFVDALRSEVKEKGGRREESHCVGVSRGKKG